MHAGSRGAEITLCHCPRGFSGPNGPLLQRCSVFALAKLAQKECTRCYGQCQSVRAAAGPAGGYGRVAAVVTRRRRMRMGAWEHWRDPKERRVQQSLRILTQHLPCWRAFA